MFGSKIEDNLEFRINWQSYTLLMRSAKMCASRSKKRSGDMFYTGPYTDVNADCILKLQHHQDTYISHCTKFGCKKAICNYTSEH